MVFTENLKSIRALSPKPTPLPRTSFANLWPWTLLVLTALFASYSNHFENEFHFDDWHTIVNNPYIRDLKNVPRFFTDARTFSSLPSNQTYRPLLSLSLAVDYRLGGLKPVYFHASTFVGYIVQLVLMFLLFVRITNLARPHPSNAYASLFAVAWYGLHPVNAETINYIVQRGELYSTLGMIGGLTAYAWSPQARRWGLYLIPPALGALCKAPALMFAPLLFVYILLFEADASSPARKLVSAARKSAPAFVICLALAIFEGRMTPKTIVLGGGTPGRYYITQTWVAAHYFKSLLLPTELSADSDWSLLASIRDPAAILGLLFLAALGLAAWGTGRKPETKPISFGLWWFLLALAPTSLVPLAEVENDHRMFFPFVGLVLSVVWSAALAIGRTSIRDRAKLVLVPVGCVCFLLPYACATHHRNRVWRSEESLWQDVTMKSPRNGRGLMNYGLTKLKQGHYEAALDYFQRARIFSPDYFILEINLGIAHAALRNNAEAERHFLRAISLAPRDGQPYFYYGQWLRSNGRAAESTLALQAAIANNPVYLEPRRLLMEVYWEQRNWGKLKELAEQTLRLFPNDEASLDYLSRNGDFDRELLEAETLARQAPSPERLLTLSLFYHRAGRYRDCIAAAEGALKLKPNYAEAYNNIAAGYEGLALWDEAIRAAEQALKIRPDYPLAKNNLLYSRNQKARNANRSP